ncbi:hypothetical protein KUTeg_011618 [Tegillarca granosa]|uniref:DH domain-containing protein n=1 Tax=Tegillarca granosa TaxID=220873 RepID=A0ABQ9EX79_TEGGR|nr:hypothetical protein KUTeg_011618 [Tegillarca granosa]
MMATRIMMFFLLYNTIEITMCQFQVVIIKNWTIEKLYSICCLYFSCILIQKPFLLHSVVYIKIFHRKNVYLLEKVSKAKDVEQGEKMKTSGEQLIMDDHYAVDSIRPKCIELQRMCDQYRQLLRRRRELLEKSHDLQDRIDNANKWCNKGIDLLANQQLDQGKSHEGADLAVVDIENFASVQKVLKRIEDVHGMCESRKEQIRKMVNVPKRPVQAVKPEPVPMSQVDGDLKRKGTTENTYRHPDIYEKSARLRTDITQSRPYITPPSPAGGSFSSLSDTLSDKARNSYSSMSTTTSSGSSVSDLDTMMAKRRHVLNELIETEKTYVTQLEDILKGYCYEMDNRHMQHLIPEELIGKKEILFGNLEQIYNFHKNIFLHELQNCQDAPAKVGKCFVQRNEEFHLYSIYCQNKLRSEALRNQIGDQNPFFMECQRRLRHKLPLGAYLLKPVQRITKYQLLLKEMLRFTDHDRECETQLQEALDSMLDVVRYVNDSMHQVSIVGFPGNLADHGRLLMQGGFTVSTEHKKEKIKDLRFKPMQRHMFLYEKSILLCKKKEDQHQHSEKRIYCFKNLLNAPSLPVKEMWVKEIKRVLMNQFDQIKVTFEIC